MIRDSYLHTYPYSVANYIESYACVFGYKGVQSLNYWVRACYHAIMIRSSTYVGMITVGRARQKEKAPLDMVTREVGRDRLVRA